MSPTTQGAIVLVATLAILLSGAPVAFGLGALSVLFLILFQGFDSLQVGQADQAYGKTLHGGWSPVYVDEIKEYQT